MLTLRISFFHLPTIFLSHNLLSVLERGEGSVQAEERQDSDGSFQGPSFRIPFQPNFSFNEFSSPFGPSGSFSQFLDGLGSHNQLTNPSGFQTQAENRFKNPPVSE